MPQEPQKISRTDLYRLVCEMPLSKLAPQFGISAIALAAICREHQVPYPGSGYWTRRQMGQQPELPMLPIGDHPRLGTISIAPTVAKPRLAKVAQDAVTAEKNHEPQTHVVPEKLTRPHWLIAEWIEERTKRRKEALASRDEWQLSNWPPFSEVDHRRHLLLDTIFKAIERGGGAISKGDKMLPRATIDGQKIEFQVREKTRQVAIAPGDERSKYMRTELVGTGRLVFSIRTYLRGRHNEEWKETDRLPLEAQVPAFVERLFEGARILKDWEAEREAERKRWAENAARRADLARLAKLEEARVATLLGLSQRYSDAMRLREFLGSMPPPSDQNATFGGIPVCKWVLWARKVLVELEADIATPERVFSLIGDIKVY